jgi:hypothetical protein
MDHDGDIGPSIHIAGDSRISRDIVTLVYDLLASQIGIDSFMTIRLRSPDKRKERRRLCL